MTLLLRVRDGEIADTFPMFAFPFEPREIHLQWQRRKIWGAGV